jgi:16S rRNA (guanine1516-N2)-methyltransferase
VELVCVGEEADGPEPWRSDFRLVASPTPGTRFYLRFDAGILRLCRCDDERGVFVRPEEIAWRRQGDFLLGRACGIRQGQQLNVLDATAGLGLDGLALADRGARVLLVERNRALWAMLANLIQRVGFAAGALPDSAGPQVLLQLGDSRRVLTAETGFRVDVVYLDPMFPARTKSALPGKRMQYLAELLRDEEPFDPGLIDLARRRAISRVVVKRRLKDDAVVAPDWQIRGRAVRYDVYRAAGSG